MYSFVGFMLSVCPIVPNTNIAGNYLHDCVKYTWEVRALPCGMQKSISDNREKTNNSSASFDVRPNMFV